MNREVNKELGEPITFEKEDVFLYYVKKDVGPIGFAAFNVSKGVCFLKYMFVEKEHRGGGIFKELLDAVKDLAQDEKATHIQAISTNIGLPLYQKQGFEITKSFVNYHKIQCSLN